MSDLHCPASLVIVSPTESESVSGSLTPAGRDQAQRLGEELAGRNVALVYTSRLPRAVQTAEIVAARLGCTVRVLAGLAELAVGDPARMADVLAEVADLHRGETVVVVGPQTGCARVELSVDADGWRFADRPGA